MGGPKRALLALFWAPGGLGPIRKRQFGRHTKTAGENGSNPIRLLKCHVRREKGPTRTVHQMKDNFVNIFLLISLLFSIDIKYLGVLGLV